MTPTNVIIIDTSRTLVRVGMGLHELLKIVCLAAHFVILAPDGGSLPAWAYAEMRQGTLRMAKTA